MGTDILPELLVEAQGVVAGDPRFRFEKVTALSIPEGDACADIVCAFSVMTHLLDEEVYMYFQQSARVLKRGGVAVFSFKDFSLPCHRTEFLHFAQYQHERHDVLKCFEKDTLRFFGEAVGMEVIEFQDAFVESPAKFPQQRLPDGTHSGNLLVMGQSLAYFRKT